jgi:hypothetical protein
MLIEIYNVRSEYSRKSSGGTDHTYYRTQKVAVLQCDCCKQRFERPVRQIDPRRLTANHTHVCSKCPAKKFAQNKGVESRRFWNTTVDLDKDIDKL